MKTLSELQNYKFRGARALLFLHERAMREFLDAWKKAKASGLQLPQSDDPDYESMTHVLYHVLRAARNYMVWMCEKLGLPDPKINPPPDVLAIEAQAEWYLAYLLGKLREPLADVEPEKFEQPAFESRWKMLYTIEGMLEHMVTHPMRHAFQLEELKDTR